MWPIFPTLLWSFVLPYFRWKRKSGPWPVGQGGKEAEVSLPALPAGPGPVSSAGQQAEGLPRPRGHTGLHDSEDEEPLLCYGWPLGSAVAEDGPQEEPGEQAPFMTRPCRGSLSLTLPLQSTLSSEEGGAGTSGRGRSNMTPLGKG